MPFRLIYLARTDSVGLISLQPLFSMLLWNIAQDIVPIRQERVYERCLKRRKKPFPYMTQTRSEYRNSVYV